MLHAVIMAGGSGTRFWPKSTKEHPKQFLTLFGDQTMLQSTVERIKSAIPADRVWVITNERYVDLVNAQLPEVPKNNIIGEPVAKNTAPCVAAAAALIDKQDPDATMAVLPADHLIANADEFISVLKAGAQKAEESDSLVTIGVQPTRPETGYGYIELKKDSAEPVGDYEVKRVAQFREKPDIATARQFVFSGRFLWNSGMFIWKTSVILDQFKKHLPDVAEQVKQLKPSIDTNQQTEALNIFYQACPSVSIDYGIMEKAENVYVIPGDFGWNDVGSWKALYDVEEKDKNDNVMKALQYITEESSGNLVHSSNGKLIALAGVENLAVVETDDVILVCNLDKAQSVKQVVNQLKESEDKKKFL
ncbi:MAG: mannose-1-phosphate guanylyltransferase [Balneolaceae bacterium]|nr:mannose-1-phosphate guanylyltransferase [Balneolaceae bacterium]